jgi:predicted enzyme related to lactoylglutathione lyase
LFIETIIMSDPMVYFEMPADDVERAKRFYENVFDWKIDYIPRIDYHSVQTRGVEMDGIGGGLIKRKAAGQPVMNYVRVSSIEECSKKVIENGGMVVLERQLVPGFGAYSIIRDTEGNLVGMHQRE